LSRIAVVAITKNGIEISRRIKSKLPEAEIFVPEKHRDSGTDINWFSDQATALVASLFQSHDAVVCIFSLGAVIRMIAPHLKDKKSDPAVIVIDDKANHVISALSGHLGGANALTKLLASFLDSRAVITTAADVNETIAVDLVGREFGWSIDDSANVTRVSALMVNEEKIAVFQDAGEKNWWPANLPKNVTAVQNIDDVKSPDFKAALIITDRIISDAEILDKSVIYRPKSLVVGVGLHFDTDRETIESGVRTTFDENKLSTKCIRNIASVNRGARVRGLDEFAGQIGVPVQIFEKSDLAKVDVPNPSKVVAKFEGTASVSEAASLLSSGGRLVVPKQKFPPNLTVAVCRI